MFVYVLSVNLSIEIYLYMTPYVANESEVQNGKY